MKYKDYNDNELLSYIKEENEEANEIIYEKYKPFIINTSKKILLKYNNLGIELNDLIQEGMLGLSYAINTYEEIHNVIFYTYAKRCIENAILTLVKKSSCNKNKYLNNAVSLENSNDDYNLEDILSDDKTPLNIIINKENNKEIYNYLNHLLTPLEYKVLILKMKGHNYKEIATLLNKSSKNIDNALTRIKNKLSR